MTPPPTIPAAAARRLFMGGQRLLEDPARPATPARVLGEIRALGFVQLDSINVVERAHHHILWTRLHAYEPHTLDTLQRRGQVFEHWTHDASVLPEEAFPHWRCRFGHVAWGSWLRERMGKDHKQVAAAVLARVRDEGPLMARDFERSGEKSGKWWDWKPAKAALEFWWRTGELAVARRVNFQKVYDLTERVLPRVHGVPAPAREQHVDWACAAALDRLGAATPSEIARFWGTVTIAEATAWCKAAAADGRAERVRLESVAGGAKGAPAATTAGSLASPKPGIAIVGWQRRVRRLPDAPSDMRLLSPFDPLVRDRARCLRLFGFDYRFEAFTPEPKRRYGYYVLPVLEGERLVARVDPKMDRDTGTLRVRAMWWEAGQKPTKARWAALERAIERYAALNGATSTDIARSERPS